MHRRTTRGNRVGLGLLGLLLTLGGAALITTNLGGFGTSARDTRLYPAGAAQWVTDHRWAYWVVGVVALVLALLALRWLLLQFRTDRISRLVMDTENAAGATGTAGTAPDDGSGRTWLAASAIASTISDETKAITGVRRAAVTLSGSRDAPELWLEVTVDQNADTGAIRSELIHGVLADARQALEQPGMPVYLTLQVSNRPGARQVA